MLHSKIGIFDDQIAVLGTFNMSLRSFFLDAECVLVVEDPEFIEELSDYYFSRIEKSVLIKYEDI
jgi:cardiolipin synthase